GSAPFYSWSGREGNEDASYIPHDPTQAAGTHYYLTPHHIEYSSKVLVTAFDAAVVTLTEIGGSEITPEAGSTTLAVGDTVVYQLAAPGDPDNDRRVNVGYELNSTGAVSVLMGQPGSDARGYLVLSPDYNPPVPPQIANFEVRRIVTALANGGSTDSARVWVDVTDFDGDLNSWTISHEGMEIIIQKGDPRVTVDDGTHLKFGPIDLGITIEPHADGLFALMVSDAAGANVVALDQVRKLSDANVTSVTPYEPLVDAKEVVVSPFFSWSIKELATRYTYELSTDQTFAGDALLIQTSTLNNEISYRDHRTDNLDGLTTYYWRVRYDLRTVQFGIDTEVISPKWAFTTRAGPDQLPPTIAAGPMVVEFDSTLVTIAWRTDKPSKGGIAYAASNFAEGERFFVAELTMTKDHLLIIRPEGTALRYDYRVLVADAFGNEDSSAVNWFRLLETPDVIAPRLASGPGRVHASDSTATLGWSTNELAKGVLNIAIDNGSGAPDAAELFEVNDDSVLALNHLVRLKDLEADTTYYFALQLRDRKNNYRDIPLRSFRTLKTPDTLPPRIVGAVTIVRTTNSTAVIRWKTSENTTAVIRYGISDLDQGRRVPVPRDRHEAEISGLAPLTPYGYVIEITDANKNEGESSPRRTFSTRETPDNTPPSFDQRPEVIASSITQTSASLRWVTNELTTGLVEFGLFDNLPSPGFTRTINAASGTNVEIQDLSPATRYAFRVTVTDLGQNRVTYPETMTFFTKSAPDPTPAEVQGTPSVAAT
ncbi:MAG: fibronectin type III domain-containing protein, partial [Candidatus Latescibacteria bacterium]|nr:fibronectin type III domain-containing protein [Candidatus Latescibacterota bacterium]